MSLYFEQIRLPESDSFRMLRWCQHPGEIEMLLANGEAFPATGAGERWHYHPEAELTLVEEGEGLRIVGDHMERFKGPDVVFLGPNLPHYWKGLHASTGISIQFSLSSPAFRSLPEAHVLDRWFCTGRHGLRFSGETCSLIRQQLKQMAESRPVRRLALFWEVLATLEEAPGDECHGLSTQDFPTIGDSPYQPQMQAAIRWIFDHALHGKVNMPELLKTIGMSKATFSRQFPKHTGRTFTALITGIRLEQARRHLADSEVAIAEAAFASGFENLSGFNRIFKRYTGESPSEYRKRMRKVQ